MVEVQAGTARQTGRQKYCTEHAIRLLIVYIHLSVYNVQYGAMTTKTKYPSEVQGTEVRLQLSTLHHRGESHYTLGTKTLMNTVGLVSYICSGTM